jgi:predicted nucleic acid-binding protein
MIDTDILIDVARGNDNAARFLVKAKEKNELAISSVTEMELLIGCRNKRELDHLDTFLSDYKRIIIDERITDEALSLLRQFRLSHGLLIADALIAATAKIKGIEFVSKNNRHFRFIQGLNLRQFS